ncbi:DNA-binding protein [Pseudomonas pseudonitroreducens]|uniref:DNA-binding protein n=1 Tax=Pseudomonas pseudonitroreducens TaxID=2892326 RepID=UPI001F1823E3|nr:DNA-binding protein [Pseudomonas pseudonitroreducens]
MLVKIGLCKGTSEKTSPNGFVEVFVLVVSEQEDQFGQMAEVTTGVRLSKNQLEKGLRDFYDTLKGKQVCVPVYNRPWKASSGAVGMDMWLSNDNGGKPIPLVTQGQLKAAS